MLPDSRVTHLRPTLAFAACYGVAAMAACGTDDSEASAGVAGGAAGDSGGFDSDGAGGAGQDGPAMCEVCAHASFVCSKPGVESVDFLVEAQTATGCAGHIAQFGGATTEYAIDCAHDQVCALGSCSPASLTASSFTWNGATCYATK